MSVFAMASAPGQAAGWIQFLPFAMILAIFYFLILLPMKRRQKKIQEFQGSLKVGDRVVTTSGIYGQITKLNEKSVQVQIADKVRIEIARAGHRRLSGPGTGRPGVGGLTCSIMNKNLRWKLLTVLGVFVVFFALGVYPMLAQRYGLPVPALAGGQAAEARARSEGRRPSRPARPDRRGAAARPRPRPASRCARSCGPPASPVASITVHVADDVPGRRRAAGQGRASSGRIADAQAAANYDRNPGVERRLHFTMKPNIANDLREQAVVQARETIDRRVNELGVAEPTICALRPVRRPDAGAAAGHCRRRPRQGDHPVDRAARAEAGRGRTGAEPRGAAASHTAARCRVTWRSSPVRRRRRATSLPGEEGRRRHRPRPAQREAVARREQPAGGQLHADQRRLAQIRQGDRREHRQVAGHRPRQAGPFGAAHRRPDHRPGHDLRLASPARKCGICR